MMGVNNEPIQLIDAMLLWAIAVKVRAEPFQRPEQLGRPGSRQTDWTASGLTSSGLTAAPRGIAKSPSDGPP